MRRRFNVSAGVRRGSRLNSRFNFNRLKRAKRKLMRIKRAFIVASLPRLQLNRSLFSFTSEFSKTLAIYNSGGGTLTWNTIDLPYGFSLGSTSGSLASSSNKTTTLATDVNKLSGNISKTFTINTNAGDSTVNIDVTPPSFNWIDSGATVTSTLSANSIAITVDSSVTTLSADQLIKVGNEELLLTGTPTAGTYYIYRGVNSTTAASMAVGYVIYIKDLNRPAIVSPHPWI